ncbi:MAG: leuD [Gammaproteobacteria bacterium]|jgi:3-isopropylmalate/(R)-2-methylmalate dehydratase small subunit|nr:leuD [Gammaproteobacteria bacterium]
MKKFQIITSRVIPLPMKDVDTDMIIPAQYLTQTNKEGYGEALFSGLKKQNANFVFNQPQYREAKILLSESNFGCGSSREHAVWALMQAGIEVIIAESYSDIFFNNAAKNGLLLISMHKAAIDAFFKETEKKEGLILTVDLEQQNIRTLAGDSFHFAYDDFRKTCLLNGYEDMDYLLDATKQ